MTRTVLVTGGTSGIGHAVAARFAAEQAEVFIAGRHADTVEQNAKELGAHGIVCDATDLEQVAELAGRVRELAVLVNAAGGLPEAGAFPRLVDTTPVTDADNGHYVK